LTNTKAALILHPVRFRIVNELTRQALTPRQIAALLPDISRPSLYRHLQILLEAGVLEIVSEQRVNGATERTYHVIRDAVRLTEGDVRAMSRDEHTQAFSGYAAMLIDTFTRYMQTTPLENLGRDGMGYTHLVTYLTPDELAQLQRELQTIVVRLTQHTPEPERKRFTLALISIPDERNSES
jgi:hypothetical protein